MQQTSSSNVAVRLKYFEHMVREQLNSFGKTSYAETKLFEKSSKSKISIKLLFLNNSPTILSWLIKRLAKLSSSNLKVWNDLLLETKTFNDKLTWTRSRVSKLQLKDEKLTEANWVK